MVVYNNILAGAAGSGGDAGYKIERSLRFDQTATAHLNRTPSTSGNKKKWTWSGWVKRCTNGNNDGLFEAEANGNYTLLRIRSDNDRISLDQYGGDNFYVYTDGVFRDNSAWYHIVCVVDTTQSTDSNRVKIYVNGVQQTLTAGTNWPSQNQDTRYNDSSYAMRVGGVNGGTQFDGYNGRCPVPRWNRCKQPRWCLRVNLTKTLVFGIQLNTLVITTVPKFLALNTAPQAPFQVLAAFLTGIQVIMYPNQ